MQSIDAILMAMGVIFLGLLVLAQTQPSGVIRQQRLAEVQAFEQRLTAIVLRGKPEDLFPLLSYEIVVSRESALTTAAVERDIRNRGEIYCRIFDAMCARRASARDILARTRPRITFYIPETTGVEDLEFAYITWQPGVFVGLERIGEFLEDLGIVSDELLTVLVFFKQNNQEVNTCESGPIV